MIAFCIIIGDTIPHVIGALFPGIGEIPVLNLLLRRRWAILVFTLSLSYPLSLYRDIAKVRFICLYSFAPFDLRSARA